MPEDGRWLAPGSPAQDDAGRPADEGRGQHHALDADVDDARPLAHDAAQGREARSGPPTDRMIGAMIGRTAIR